MVDFYGGSDRLIGVRVALPGGGSAFAAGQVAVNASGNPASGNVYQLASNQALAAQAGTPANPTSGSVTTPTTGVQSGSYLWDVQFSGAAGASIQLQALGSDGTTWRTVATQTIAAGQTAFGGTVGVVLGQNSTVRLYNASTAATGVYSSLS